MSEQNICLFCGDCIEEPDFTVIFEHGPFGLYEGKSIGNMHNECYESYSGEDEDDECEEEEDEDDE